MILNKTKRYVKYEVVVGVDTVIKIIDTERKPDMFGIEYVKDTDNMLYFGNKFYDVVYEYTQIGHILEEADTLTESKKLVLKDLKNNEFIRTSSLKTFKMYNAQATLEGIEALEKEKWYDYGINTCIRVSDEHSNGENKKVNYASLDFYLSNDFKEVKVPKWY